MNQTATSRYLVGGKAGAAYFLDPDFLDAISDDINSYARLRAMAYTKVTAFLATFGREYDDHALIARIDALEFSRQYRDTYKAIFDAMSIAEMLDGRAA